MTWTILRFEELYEPWEVLDDVPRAGFPQASDLPDELVQRFRAAKAEMTAVWDEMRRYERRPV